MDPSATTAGYGGDRLMSGSTVDRINLYVVEDDVDDAVQYSFFCLFRMDGLIIGGEETNVYIYIIYLVYILYLYIYIY